MAQEGGGAAPGRQAGPPAGRLHRSRDLQGSGLARQLQHNPAQGGEVCSVFRHETGATQ